MPVMGWLIFVTGLLLGLLPAAYLAGRMRGRGER
jgi:hypothetical protein